jgi:hypothetical protein
MMPGGDRSNIGHDAAGRFASAVMDPSGAARIHREFGVEQRRLQDDALLRNSSEKTV